MKKKLTLSLPEKSIAQAKQIARRRHTTVSALFTESLRQWQFDTDSAESVNPDPLDEMSDLLGVLPGGKPFDARSARIREKHG